MAELTPAQSVKLANDIYLTQKDAASVEFFFDLHSTILSNDQQTLMKAEVGSRLISTRDTFGVCAQGVGEFERDVFLVFRGSTNAN